MSVSLSSPAAGVAGGPAAYDAPGPSGAEAYGQGDALDAFSRSVQPHHTPSPPRHAPHDAAAAAGSATGAGGPPGSSGRAGAYHSRPPWALDEAVAGPSGHSALGHHGLQPGLGGPGASPLLIGVAGLRSGAAAMLGTPPRGAAAAGAAVTPGLAGALDSGGRGAARSRAAAQRAGAGAADCLVW
jgi:hypothetical protein